jgi:short subunit dehydrogenase-like uncharacterized protein
VRVYTGAPPAAIRRLRRLRPLLPVAGLAPVKALLRGWVDRREPGPDARTRETARVYLWGRAVDAATGASVTATLETPEGYRFTAEAAVECTLRLLAGGGGVGDPGGGTGIGPGAWTPARAFGAGLVAALPGVVVGALVRSHSD